jgi:transposase
LLLLDEGWSCEQVAKALFLDDDTIRSWYRLYQKDGILGLAWHGPPGLSCQINVEHQEKLKARVLLESPRTTRQIGSYISQ